MNDLISRKAVLELPRNVQRSFFGEVISETVNVKAIEALPPAEIGYGYCSDALLKMWIDNVITDGEYNRIMDKLNAHWGMKNG